jgi:hypothetical protein
VTTAAHRLAGGSLLGASGRALGRHEADVDDSGCVIGRSESRPRVLQTATARIHMSRDIRSCYISAPAGTQLKNPRASLAERGIEVLVPEDLASGFGWQTDLQQTIARAELVIGVLTKERRSQWVLFELGQAKALDRQIVLLAPPSIGSLPSTMHGLLVLRVNLGNRRAVDFALDQLLAAPPPLQQPPISGKAESGGLGPRVDQLLRELRELSHMPYGRGLEEITAKALRESGVDLVVKATEPDRGADLAIWSDVLESYIGNPLLVEIKNAIREPGDVRRFLQELASAVQRSGTRWGLLLYMDGPPSDDRAWKACPPTILVHSLPALLEAMRDRSFPEIIRDLRNRRVHGGRP